MVCGNRAVGTLSSIDFEVTAIVRFLKFILIREYRRYDTVMEIQIQEWIVAWNLS